MSGEYGTALVDADAVPILLGWIMDGQCGVSVRVALSRISCEKAAGRASNLRDTRDWDLFADREYRRLVDAEEDEDAPPLPLAVPVPLLPRPLVVAAVPR